VQDLLCSLLAAVPNVLTRPLDCSKFKQMDKILKYHPNNILLEGKNKDVAKITQYLSSNREVTL